MSHSLYQDIILKHSREPFNYGKMKNPTQKQEGYNKICGDYIEVYVKIEGEKIKDISFIAESCAITKASASLMTQHLKNKSLAQTQQAVESFQDFLNQKVKVFKKGSDLNFFKELWEYPTRIQCALLPWQTLHATLKDR